MMEMLPKLKEHGKPELHTGGVRVFVHPDAEDAGYTSADEVFEFPRYQQVKNLPKPHRRLGIRVTTFGCYIKSEPERRGYRKWLVA